ncbi:MAG: MetQ/NlpA family ABC transporter substrate-binding protein [Leptolyngbyaceae cyanobacterium MO_188.B28]|nr:MetQ/NlpA family ABC transporter substrate-binding protein [Leptolyngbyaceae cyanobacterium MO_188.B28]
MRFSRRIIFLKIKAKLTSFKGFLALFLVSLLSVLSLNGCSFKAGDDLTLQVGITNWPGYDVVLYAQAAGLFENRGLDVKLVRFSNPQDAARALLRGSIDASFMNLSVAMQADPGNDSPVFIMVADTSYGSDGIVAQSEIHTVEDLKGKRVAAKLGAANHLILLEALQANQIKPEEVAIENVSNEIAQQLMETGKVDAAATWEPLLSQIKQATDGNIIHTTKDVDTLVIDGLASRSAVVVKKKEAFKRFILAWFDLMQVIAEEPDKVFVDVAAQLGQSADSFARDYAGLKPGDIAMNQRMLPGGRLQEAAQQLKQLLSADSRHSRVLRDDFATNSKPVVAAIELGKS